MELSHIRSFLAVAREGNMSRAAERLLLSQPAVTQHIQILEREFQTALFDRTGRGMKLTATGRALERHFEEALNCLERGKALAGEIRSGLTGVLTIGCAISLSADGVTGAIYKMHQKHPRVKLSIRVARSEVITSMLLDGQLDLGIASMGHGSKALHATPLFTQQFLLVAAATHPFAGKTITTSQLAKVELIGCAGGPWVGLEPGTTALQKTPVTVESDTLQSIKSLAIAGLGCALLPAHNLVAELQRGELRPICLRETSMPSRVVSLIRRRDMSLSAAMNAFIVMAKEAYRPNTGAAAVEQL